MTLREKGCHAMRRWSIGLLAVLIAAGCNVARPQPDPQVAQAMQDMSDEVSSLRPEHALLQAQLDSMRTVVARQDTALRKLSNLAGMPMR